MITPEQRRKMEASWSPEDRSLANTCRLAKVVVVMMMLMGVTLIGARDKGADSPVMASAATYAAR